MKLYIYQYRHHFFLITSDNIKFHSLFTAVCQSIQNPVTKEILFNFIDNHAWRNPQKHGQKHGLENGGNQKDRALMPPPAKQPRH